MTNCTNFARPEDLLERSLIELREVLRSDVLTACDLTGPASNRVPVPRTCDLTWLETLTRLLDLIRKYTVAGTGPKAVVRVEIEVSHPSSLGYLLETIGEAQREAEAARSNKAKQKPAKPLALPYYGKDQP